jgi:hypothetical protein
VRPRCAKDEGDFFLHRAGPEEEYHTSFC